MVENRLEINPLNLLLFFLDGLKTVYSRGCAVRGSNDESTCKNGNKGETPQWCKVCTSDKCNSASKFSFTLILLVSLLIHLI